MNLRNLIHLGVFFRSITSSAEFLAIGLLCWAGLHSSITSADAEMVSGSQTRSTSGPVVTITAFTRGIPTFTGSPLPDGSDDYFGNFLPAANDGRPADGLVVTLRYNPTAVNTSKDPGRIAGDAAIIDFEIRRIADNRVVVHSNSGKIVSTYNLGEMEYSTDLKEDGEDLYLPSVPDGNCDYTGAILFVTAASQYLQNNNNALPTSFDLGRFEVKNVGIEYNCNSGGLGIIQFPIDYLATDYKDASQADSHRQLKVQGLTDYWALAVGDSSALFAGPADFEQSGVGTRSTWNRCVRHLNNKSLQTWRFAFFQNFEQHKLETEIPPGASVELVYERFSIMRKLHLGAANEPGHFFGADSFNLVDCAIFPTKSKFTGAILNNYDARVHVNSPSPGDVTITD